MQVKYITIEREYGSGGTSIARCLSENTGIACYGREILEAVAKKYNRSVDQLEQYEEKVTGSLLYSLFALSQVSSANPDLLTMEGRLFAAEQEAIRSLAAKGPAVFIGHCASEALKDKPGVLRVFIRCADEAKKKERIAREYNIAGKDIDSVRKKFDRKRAAYYYANANKKWDDFRNYHIVIDSGILGIEKSADILKVCFISDR